MWHIALGGGESTHQFKLTHWFKLNKPHPPDDFFPTHGMLYKKTLIRIKRFIFHQPPMLIFGATFQSDTDDNGVNKLNQIMHF